MSRLPVSAYQSRLDTKDIPQINDIAMAEIGILAAADTAQHALMTGFSYPPICIVLPLRGTDIVLGSQLDTDGDVKVCVVVPPMVSKCRLTLLATGFDCRVDATVREMDGTLVDGGANYFEVSDSTEDSDDLVDLNDDDYNATWHDAVGKAQRYDCSESPTLRSSPDWNPHPVYIHLERPTPTRNAYFVALYVEFLHPLA